MVWSSQENEDDLKKQYKLPIRVRVWTVMDKVREQPEFIQRLHKNHWLDEAFVPTYRQLLIPNLIVLNERRLQGTIWTSQLLVGIQDVKDKIPGFMFFVEETTAEKLRELIEGYNFTHSDDKSFERMI